MESVTTPPFETANADQLRAWDGDEGAYWATHADAFDDAVRCYHKPLLRAAAVTARDLVLDIGCGAGQTTIEAARRAVDGSALGIDLSAAMLDVARARAVAASVSNVAFVQGDAQVHEFGREIFDVVMSRTGSMFFADPVAAFANAAHATRRGGRLTMLVWQPAERNEWFLAIMSTLSTGRRLPTPPPDAPSPFSLSDPDRVRRILEAADWNDVALTALEQPMYFGPEAGTATAFVAGLLDWLLRDLDDEQRRTRLDDLHAVMAAHQTREGVALGSAAWLVTARHS